MAAWAGVVLIDRIELDRRQTELMAGPPAGRATAIRLSFGRAALELAGELGYQQMRTGELIERAGSNRVRFYDAFADKEACFAWAYEAAWEALCERLLGACAAADDWAAGMRGALSYLTRFVGAEPAVAASLLARPGGAGDMVAAKREEVFGRLSRAIDRARRETIASRHPVPPITPRFILSAIQSAALRFLADPDGRSFEEQLPGLLYLAVNYYLGTEAARAEVRALKEAR
jgi:AcrR family transcriptional regulator